MWQRSRGVARASVERARNHLLTILDVARNGHRPLRWVTPARAAALYDQVQVGRAVDTHRNSLAAGRAWGKFCVRRGWSAINPFAAVEPVGRRKHGKPQLTADEARRLLATCLDEGTREAIAVACALLLGLRATEIASRQVRDLDDEGRVFVVTHGKTSTAKRRLEVPEVLRSRLRELAAGRSPTSPLFGGADLDRPTRHWIHWHCSRLCRAARVPIVPPHGLRGTHASLAASAGATSHVVAAALGHSTTAITEAAYIDGGALTSRDQRAVLRVITGGS